MELCAEDIFIYYGVHFEHIDHMMLEIQIWATVLGQYSKLDDRILGSPGPQFFLRSDHVKLIKVFELKDGTWEKPALIICIIMG